MSITTYAELKTAVQDWLDDSGIGSDADTYIDLAEAKFNRVLRLREMEESATLTPDSSGEASLPADFLEVRRLAVIGSPAYELSYATPQFVRDYDTYDVSGYAAFYTIEDGVVRVRPITANTLNLVYYEKIPALSDSQTTNWLLDRAPDLYLVACQMEYAWKTMDYELQGRAEQRMERIIQQMEEEDKAARWPNATTRVKGLTP
jgi:hypothetical protein